MSRRGKNKQRRKIVLARKNMSNADWQAHKKAVARKIARNEEAAKKRAEKRKAEKEVSL